MTFSIKTSLCSFGGAVGGFIVYLAGGWGADIQTLIIFMAADFLTGILVAAVFKKSNKTKTGALESTAGWKGLCRKCMTFIFVIIAYRLDVVMGTDYIRSATIIGFIINEAISIVENAGLMGLPLPGAIIKAIEILKTKGENQK